MKRFTKPDPHGALSVPVYRNVAFEFAGSEAIAAAFRGETGEHTYSRISNPTVAAFEERVRTAAGADSVVALSSGMAAITNTFFAIASAGSNIVASPHLFGNTFSFFRGILAAFGVETRFVDTGDVAAVEAATDDKTCAFFAELVTNPHLEIADFPAISQVLRPRGVPVIVDSTLIPWCGFRGAPGEWAPRVGVDVEIVSTTKYVSGGASATGGVIVDHGTADWSRNPRLASMPSPPNGISRFTHKLRTEVVRNLGAVMTPDTAALHTLGQETMPVRYERMSATASQLAHHFAGHPKVADVGYPGLPGSPYKALSDAMFEGTPGAMFTVSLGSQADCFRFMDALGVFHRATNLFDNRSLVIHPSSTIYCTFTPEMKRLAGIKDNLIRFSVGVEEPQDLAHDIENALKAL
jgi:O-acetylhomoserine (thiol)-lyase